MNLSGEINEGRDLSPPWNTIRALLSFTNRIYSLPIQKPQHRSIKLFRLVEHRNMTSLL